MDLNLDLEAMAAPPPPGVDRGPVPWEDPALGRWRGFGRTLRFLFFSPGDFFQDLDRGEGSQGLAEPFAFGLITGTAGFLAAIFWFILLWAALNRAAAAISGMPQIFDAATGLALAAIVLSPLVVAANLVTGALCLWAAAAVVGKDAGFRPAWRILCYAQGGMLLGLMPFLGAPVAGIWVLSLIYLGSQRLLETASFLRPLAAVFIFLLLQGLLWMLITGSLAALLGLLGFLLFLGGS